MIRRLPTHQLVVDIAVPAALFLVLLIPYIELGWLRLVVLAGMCAALTLRRLSPALALATVWGASLWQVVLGLEPDPMSLAILPVLYATARYGSATIRWAGLISAGVGAVIITIYVT